MVLSDAEPDRYGEAEARLIRRLPAWLEPVWSDAHWHLYRVRHAVPLVPAPAEVVSATDAYLIVWMPEPGSVTVRLAYSPWLHTVVSVDAQVAPERTPDIRPTTAYTFRPAGKADVPITVLQIGDVVVVGVQAELCSSTGLEIEAQSPFERTVVATVVDGAAKYMADARSYERITYEAMNSRYARGSAEVVTTAVLSLLTELRA
ncbi:hypothetical protein [Streptomyces sp. YIM S03343]